HAAKAAEHLGHRDEAIAAWKALALLDETDPAETHFRLAKLLGEAGRKDEARREVLKSLEEAPRFLDAHRLLLDLTQSRPETTPEKPSSDHANKAPEAPPCREPAGFSSPSPSSACSASSAAWPWRSRPGGGEDGAAGGDNPRSTASPPTGRACRTGRST